MQLTFLGSASNNGGSPTLFGTDRGTYLIQGSDLRQRVSRTWCDVRFFFELCSAKSV